MGINCTVFLCLEIDLISTYLDKQVLQIDNITTRIIHASILIIKFSLTMSHIFIFISLIFAALFKSFYNKLRFLITTLIHFIYVLLDIGSWIFIHDINISLLIIWLYCIDVSLYYIIVCICICIRNWDKRFCYLLIFSRNFLLFLEIRHICKGSLSIYLNFSIFICYYEFFILLFFICLVIIYKCWV